MKLVIMSKGKDIPIDDDEVATVMAAAVQRRNVLVRQGLINTRFFVSIVPDIVRMKGWNRQIGKEQSLPTFHDPLKDEFKNVREDVKKILSAADKINFKVPPISDVTKLG